MLNIELYYVDVRHRFVDVSMFSPYVLPWTQAHRPGMHFECNVLPRFCYNGTYMYFDFLIVGRQLHVRPCCAVVPTS
jgi:hypothetical protein